MVVASGGTCFCHGRGAARRCAAPRLFVFVCVFVTAWQGTWFGVACRTTCGREVKDSTKSASNSKSKKLAKNGEKKAKAMPRTKPPAKTAKPPDRTPPPVRRGATPKTPPDPSELDVRPGDDGRVSVAFHGQPWIAVLDWLAEISAAALRCELAPAGYVDFLVTEPTPVPEIRDGLNRMLLSQGYTLVRNGEVLTLLSLRSLNVETVPRATVRDLDDLGHYEFATVAFDLRSLTAPQVAADLRATLGRNGRIECMRSMNRLLVMDTGENLRHMRDLLTEEQAQVKNASAFRVFPLRYVRADDAAETLRKVLGLESPDARAQTPGRLVHPAERASQTPRPTLAVDARRNAILVSAPTDRIGVAERAVEFLDVPAAGGARASEIESKSYRLSTIEASWLQRFLANEGGFDTRVRFALDERSNSLVVSASANDHLVIASLIEKVDEPRRRREVVDLHTLDAVQVGRMIERLLDRDEGKALSGRQPSPSQNVTGSDALLIQADRIGNRLLLRVSPGELAEIRTLLAKLGERRFDEQAEVLTASPRRGFNALSSHN